jgi:hypothetical protein
MAHDQPDRTFGTFGTALTLCGLLVLAAYSLALLVLEATTSQATVRPYFSDIGEDQPLFAVNTTISASLLAGAALLMLFAALSTSSHGSRREGRFLLSQAALFGFLAADDRFQLHERIGWRLGIPDHYVLFVWALLAALALAALHPPSPPRRAVALYMAGASLFAAMFVIDAFAPAEAALRLSIEDLCKVWGAAMFFAFGWIAARHHLRGTGQAEPLLCDHLRSHPGAPPRRLTN